MVATWFFRAVHESQPLTTEGRRSFLERYAGIESGAECERWLPAISAPADGEASSEDVLELRSHLRNCPGCRATLRALRESSTPLSAVLPVPLIVAESAGGTHVLDTFMRLYEGVAGSVHERAVHSVTKAQALIEASGPALGEHGLLLRRAALLTTRPSFGSECGSRRSASAAARTRPTRRSDALGEAPRTATR